MAEYASSAQAVTLGSRMLLQVLEQLQGIAMEVMGKAMDSSAPLMAAGLDSLAAVELKNAVSSKFGVNLQATLAFDYPTLDALSGFILSSLHSSASAAIPGLSDTKRSLTRPHRCKEWFPGKSCIILH